MMVLPQIETITTDTDLDQRDSQAKKLGDIRFLALVIQDSNLDPTIENALAFLAKGRANKPMAWTITAEELQVLWADMVSQ